MRLSVPAIVLSLCAVFTAASPTEVTIGDITYAGSGCRAGSVAVAGNEFAVTLSFDSYTASIGPNIPFTERRKNCNINFRLHYPQGYSFTVYKTNYIGIVKLEDGIKATQRAQSWFAGHPPPPPPPVISKWTGPVFETYNVTETFKKDDWVWSPCGAFTTLNVDTQIYLENGVGHGSGYITTDDIEHKAKTIFGIQWKKCP